MNITSAIFDRSAPDLLSCPDESLPEFAFIGRSNVGKSSLLNMLAGKNGLARVSPVPGFTKLINFFTMNKRWRLVDLPGYGFAKVARKDSARFNQAVDEYLRNRRNLCCIFALIDSNIPPQSIDLEFVEGLAINQLPFVLVFTKTDASKATRVKANIEAFQSRISELFEELPAVFTCSAKNKQGRQELLGVIEAALRDGETSIEAEAAAEAPVPSEEPPQESRAADPAEEDRTVTLRKAQVRRPNPARPW
ncbi:MAG: YihA family ribosome biogenesis GTP-binding protein [Verrucomicrobiales bacterium]|nr:YihA family ribosome biogenesis GTP-binding protein [Verrucomicrobiales bacterium]